MLKKFSSPTFVVYVTSYYLLEYFLFRKAYLCLLLTSETFKVYTSKKMDSNFFKLTCYFYNIINLAHTKNEMFLPHCWKTYTHEWIQTIVLISRKYCLLCHNMAQKIPTKLILICNVHIQYSKYGPLAIVKIYNNIKNSICTLFT